MRRRSVLLVAGVLAACLGAVRPAAADIASDHPAAILVFPKLIVDTTEGLDTVVRISNVSDTPLNVYCFYVNATPECSLDEGTSCFPNRVACLGEIEGHTTGGTCLSKWQETDFIIRLTKDQPTGWLVSGGERTDCPFIQGVCANDNTISCGTNRPCPTGRCILPPCLPLDGTTLGRIGPNGQTNEGAVPISPEDPFVGELKCIAIDEAQQPVARNDLVGEVLIGRKQSGPEQAIEVEGYNAIGIPALLNTCLPNGTCSQTATPCPNGNVNCPSLNNRDGTLILGGPAATAEYEGCPNILVLDHYFDGAVDPVVTNFCRPDHTCSVSGTACMNDNQCLDNICLGGPGGACSVTDTPCNVQADCDNTCDPTNVCTLSGEHCLNDDDCTDPSFQTRVVTEVTLIPCTEDFKNQAPEISKTTVQFLVYNEFEQRFSASTPVECFKELRLSSVDTPMNARSIFSAGVGGTLTGQTKIRGVQNDDPGVARPHGNALLGVAEEFRCGGPKYQFPLCNFVDDPERVVSTNAKNLHFQGRRPTSDYIYLPQP